MRILLGERLRSLREELELTQIEAAKYLKCSPKMLSNYELNKREPDLLMIKNICDYYHVSTDFLLGRTQCRYMQTDADPAINRLIQYYHALPTKYQQELLRYARLNFQDLKTGSHLDKHPQK